MLSLARDFCIKLEGTGFQQSFLVCKVGHKVAEWTRPWIESACEKKPLRLKEALVVIPSRDDMRDNDDFSTILEAYKYKCPFDPQRKRFSRWWFQFFFGIFTPILGEMIQFDEHIFQMGWNHQPVLVSKPSYTRWTTTTIGTGVCESKILKWRNGMGAFDFWYFFSGQSFKDWAIGMLMMLISSKSMP